MKDQQHTALRLLLSAAALIALGVWLALGSESRGGSTIDAGGASHVADIEERALPGGAERAPLSSVTYPAEASAPTLPAPDPLELQPLPDCVSTGDAWGAECQEALARWYLSNWRADLMRLLGPRIDALHELYPPHVELPHEDLVHCHPELGPGPRKLATSADLRAFIESDRERDALWGIASLDRAVGKVQIYASLLSSFDNAPAPTPFELGGVGAYIGPAADWLPGDLAALAETACDFGARVAHREWALNAFNEIAWNETWFRLERLSEATPRNLSASLLIIREEDYAMPNHRRGECTFFAAQQLTNDAPRPLCGY